MLNYISFAFLLLLPVLVGITYLLPVKARSLFFLLAGACLYASMGIRFLPVLFLSVCSTYTGARLCEQQGGEVNREKDERSKSLGQRRMALVLCIGFNLSFLFVFKYLRLFAPGMAVAAPFGISFFVLTGLGYVIDCYRGKYQAEKNFLTYAAFSSFFPLIASGPIERADHLIPQMKRPGSLSYRRLQSGMLLMIWGYFLKLVLANRLSILVQSGFENPQSQTGILLILSVLAFTFEIYCDFYGYSSIAKGCAALLGIEVMDNFKSPYLSGNIAEFWRRWHISLSTWFRDYLYIPLGGNRRGNLRRDRNLLIVFLVSGIWHGAGITYLFWGFLHGLALIFYDRSKAVFAWGEKRVGIRTGALSHRIFCVLLNLSFVSFAWIFFHATTLSQGFSVVRNLFPLHLDRIFAGGILQMGLDLPNLLVLLVGLALLLFADLCTDRGLVLRERIATQGVWLRFLIEIGAICLILILGIWGASIQGDSFIYAQF